MELTTAPFENFVTGKVAEYSNELLRTSTFFSRLGAGTLTMDTLRYVFGQYRFWRDQFHTWFGICILKSGSCASEEVSATVYALASHIASEMADDHAKMYRNFLFDLGIPAAEIDRTCKADATVRYERSFLDEFGTGSENFVDSVIALSGRELFAAYRNRYVMAQLESKYGLPHSQWWELHDELEEQHFQSCIRPFVRSPMQDQQEAERLIGVIRHEMDRHAAYWDALLDEAQYRKADAA